MSIPLRIVDPDDTSRRLEPGDMWHDHDHPRQPCTPGGPRGDSWAILLPNRAIWHSCQPFGGDPSRGYWTVTGEAPNITVAPSIDDQDERAPWHGWIRDGQLVDA